MSLIVKTHYWQVMKKFKRFVFFLNYISSSLTSPVNNSYLFSLLGAFVQMGFFGASFVLTPLSC